MIYWLWFSKIIEISPKTKLELLKTFRTTKNIYYSNKDEFFKNGFSHNLFSIIKSKVDLNVYERMYKYMINNNIMMVNIYDNGYPDTLKKIYDPPVALFLQGDVSTLTYRKIGVVGTRMATMYGMKTAYQIGEDLGNENICTVSGLAIGIDAYAHMGALNSGGNTIAVLGNGIDYIYPKENISIYKKIKEKGLLISEYVPGTKPYPQNFPRRNRIISGLSDSIIVVEASHKSGALITADIALDNGKDIYAVPR